MSDSENGGTSKKKMKKEETVFSWKALKPSEMRDFDGKASLLQAHFAATFKKGKGAKAADMNKYFDHFLNDGTQIYTSMDQKATVGEFSLHRRERRGQLTGLTNFLQKDSVVIYSNVDQAMVSVSVSEATSVLLSANGFNVDKAASAFIDGMEPFCYFICTSLKLDQIKLQGGTTLLTHAKACAEKERRRAVFT